jgi:hypothetical protein
MMKHLALLAPVVCLLFGCQGKEEEVFDLDSMVKEDFEVDENWEYEVGDDKALAGDSEGFTQEIIIQEEPLSPSNQNSPETFR